MRVVIVGGGVIGMSAALRLAQKGAEVCVVERAGLDRGASWAAGGILAPQVEASQAGPFLDLCVRSFALYPAFVAELEERTGLRLGFRQNGTLVAALDGPQLEALRRRHAWQQEHGFPSELLTRADARSLEPALNEEMRGALYVRGEGQVDNRLLMQALERCAIQVGISLRKGAAQAVAERQGRAIGVHVEGRLLEADAVVIAAGAASALVHGSGLAPRSVRAARGQMLCFQWTGPTPLLSRVVFVEDGYLVPRMDGRILAGSTVELLEANADAQVTGSGLSSVLQRALKTCPALGQTPVMDLWAGLRPYTGDHLPILGAGPLAGLFYATGHFRNGILLAPVTAELLAHVVMGGRAPPELEAFRYDRSPISSP